MTKTRWRAPCRPMKWNTRSVSQAMALRQRSSSLTSRTSTSRSTRITTREVARMRDVGTLLEALPYIREFHGRTIVIKYGGAAMNDPDLCEEVARDVVLLKYVGVNPVVVHGGGPEITAYMQRLALPVEFVDGLRVSDEATVEIAK